MTGDPDRAETTITDFCKLFGFSREAVLQRFKDEIEAREEAANPETTFH
ncbi:MULTISPECIES: hypothetical protein [unclassified Bradyrhizobium]|nr:MULTISPECIES: hypothetical protein [unclassified Bradyrhizobium]